MITPWEQPNWEDQFLNLEFGKSFGSVVVERDHSRGDAFSRVLLSSLFSLLRSLDLTV